MSSVRSNRKNKVHAHAVKLGEDVSRINSNLNNKVSAVLIYAAAMHQVAKDEAEAVLAGTFAADEAVIGPSDVSFYDNLFNAELAAINASLARIQPLIDVQTGAMTKDDFIASIDPVALAAQIAAFDKAD
jgi:hypothetical protein